MGVLVTKDDVQISNHTSLFQAYSANSAAIFFSFRLRNTMHFDDLCAFILIVKLCYIARLPTNIIEECEEPSVGAGHLGGYPRASMHP